MARLLAFSLLAAAVTSSNFASAQSRCWSSADTLEHTQFRDAVVADDLSLAKLLILNGQGYVNFDSRGSCKPPIFYAIENQSLQMVQLLVTYGADINFVVSSDYSTTTVLGEAVRRRSFAVVEYLLNLLGLKANARDRDGKTAIQIAMENFDRHKLIKEEFQIVLALAKSPAVDVNTAQNGYSTLQLGIGTYSNVHSSQKDQFLGDYMELAQTLIKRSNDFINFQGKYTGSALAWTFGNRELFDLMMQHPHLRPFDVTSLPGGSNGSGYDGLGYNILDVAVRSGVPYALQRLLARADLPAGALETTLFHRKISGNLHSFETYIAIFDDPRINPNAINDQGQSLLEFELTTTSGWPTPTRVIEKILNLPGVDVNIHNGAPLKIARENLAKCSPYDSWISCDKAHAIVKLLEAKGAQ